MRCPTLVKIQAEHWQKCRTRIHGSRGVARRKNGDRSSRLSGRDRPRWALTGAARTRFVLRPPKPGSLWNQPYNDDFQEANPGGVWIENSKDTLCRNVTIYGRCRYEDKGEVERQQRCPNADGSSFPWQGVRSAMISSRCMPHNGSQRCTEPHQSFAFGDYHSLTIVDTAAPRSGSMSIRPLSRHPVLPTAVLASRSGAGQCLPK